MNAKIVAGALLGGVAVIGWMLQPPAPPPVVLHPAGDLPGRFAALPLSPKGVTARPLDDTRLDLSWPAGTPWQQAFDTIAAPLLANGWTELHRRELPAGVSVSWTRGGEQVGAIVSETPQATRIMLALVEPHPAADAHGAP
ncbi:MAG TPA: hypothetical protein PKA64_04050 [Myxococcota bacterium]|nr:hypothetical protein [Myxococcota bacterium]